jgi:hypothetical protein
VTVDDTDFGLYNPTAESVSIDCPVPDDDRVAKSVWTIANVEAYLNSTGTIYAEACYATWNGQLGGCSSSVSASGTGHVELALAPYIGSSGNFWDTNSGTDFGYVYVNVPPGARVAGVYYAH